MSVYILAAFALGTGVCAGAVFLYYYDRLPLDFGP